jgi:cysteine-rich secretory family protein
MRHPKTTDHRRARRATRLLLPILITLLLVTLAAPAHATMRSRYLRIINHTRAQHDLRPLKLNGKLSDTAKGHTRKMIREGRLFDMGNLAVILAPYAGYQTMGADVVGCGDTLFQMHQLMMHHAYHRNIILSNKVDFVGIGAIHRSGRSGCGRNQFWATAIFFG